MSSSAKRALNILATVGASSRPLGVTEIARSLDLPPGTTFRGLDALKRADLVSHYQASSRYVLGHAASALKQTLLARFRIRELCLPYLRQLASLTGEASSLYVRLGWYAVRVASVPGGGDVTNAPALGDLHPLPLGHAGRAILAHLPEGERDRCYAWSSGTSFSLPAKRVLRDELKSIRARGFAVGGSLFGDRRAPVALPICKSDQPIAALTIDGPVFDPGQKSGKRAPPEWASIVRAVEGLARANPSLFDNPFAHLDPDEIRLIS